MLTLSDEIKIWFELPAEYEERSVRYLLYQDDKLLYFGQIYYTGPSEIYVNDIIETYMTDYSWFGVKSGTGKAVHKVLPYTFKITMVLENNHIFQTDWIENRTVIPTVDIARIPSVIPKHPSENFFFSWLCPVQQTKIALQNSTSAVIDEYTFNNQGHTTVYFNDECLLKDAPQILRFTTSMQRIAVQDEHNSRFYLLWITRGNDYMCRPFCKKSSLTESVSTSYMHTSNNLKKPYAKTSNYNWTLNSDWLTYDEHNVYESLMISPIVYMYDNYNGEMHRVNVTDSKWTEKNSNNNRKPFNLTVNVELAKESKITY